MQYPLCQGDTRKQWAMASDVANIRNYANSDLLWISDDPPPPAKPGSTLFSIGLDANFEIYGYSQRIDDDPSTIFTKLPAKLSKYSPALDYWPSYWSMTPEQRGTYLMWLSDVTKPVDIGYVFTYYYGLEKHLVLGNFRDAFREIVKLRRFHHNKSFLQYSKNALLFSCLLKKDVEPLLELAEQDQFPGFNSVQLIIAEKLRLDLTAWNVMHAFAEIDPKSKKAIKDDSKLYISCVEKALKDENDFTYLPFSKKYSSFNLKKNRQVAFSNYAFPSEFRFMDIPDFYCHQDFCKELFRLSNIGYGDYKNRRAAARSNLTLEEVEFKRILQDKKRITTLYKTGKIKKNEYEILMKQFG